MPKEPEGTSSAPGDIPGSQGGSHDSSQEQTMPKHSTESNTDDAKGKEFDHHDGPSPAGKEKDDLSPIPDKLDSEEEGWQTLESSMCVSAERPCKLSWIGRDGVATLSSTGGL